MSTPSYNDGNMSPDMMMTNEEEEVEAISNDELVGAMLQAKNDRRRAESDVQLLANRLAHLRAEEEKARRKIAETQRRAKEVRDIKIENARIQREKMEEKRQRQEMVQREQQRVAMRRAQQRAKRKGANSKLNKDKLLHVRQQREQAKAHRDKVLKSKAAEERRAKELKDKIRQREIRLKMKKEEEEKKRRQQQAKAYRQRLLLERKKQDIADKQISAMEEKEMELIERLRRTQDLQRQAYSSLENALQEPVDLSEIDTKK